MARRQIRRKPTRQEIEEAKNRVNIRNLGERSGRREEMTTDTYFVPLGGETETKPKGKQEKAAQPPTASQTVAINEAKDAINERFLSGRG